MATPGKKLFGLIVIEENKESSVDSLKTFLIRNLIKNPAWLTILFWLITWIVNKANNINYDTLENLMIIYIVLIFIIISEGVVSACILLFGNDHKALHDLVAGTAVIYGYPEKFHDKK